jgi:antitoxin (DNA-binding transcriptional repressor) of toxin-antitoxin stability system
MVPRELEISVTEFKAKCLELFDRLSTHELKRITVTRRGRPVAELTPPKAKKAKRESLFGCMKGRMIAPPGYDFTEPLLDLKDFDAAKGFLHR